MLSKRCENPVMKYVLYFRSDFSQFKHSWELAFEIHLKTISPSKDSA